MTIYFTASDSGHVWEFSRSVMKVGTLESSHIRLNGYEGVSRMHAVIEIHAGSYSVIDLGSAGGTLVNGVKINKRELQDGDELEFGEAMLKLSFTKPVVHDQTILKATQDLGKAIGRTGEIAGFADFGKAIGGFQTPVKTKPSRSQHMYKGAGGPSAYVDRKLGKDKLGAFAHPYANVLMIVAVYLTVFLALGKYETIAEVDLWDLGASYELPEPPKPAPEPQKTGHARDRSDPTPMGQRSCESHCKGVYMTYRHWTRFGCICIDKQGKAHTYSESN